MVTEATFVGRQDISTRRMDEFQPPEWPMDFGQQQAKQFVIENRTTDPESPVSGQIWLRTDL